MSLFSHLLITANVTKIDIFRINLSKLQTTYTATNLVERTEIFIFA